MRSRLATLAAVAGLLGLVMGAGGSSPPGATADVAAPAVTATPTSGVTDGQAINVNVQTTSDVPVYQASAQLCRGAVAYQPSSDPNLPPPDSSVDGPNCPGSSHPVSSSSDSYVVDTLTFSNAPEPGGETFQFHAGSGTVSWTAPSSGTPESLTCDETHSCVLLVELLFSPSQNAPAQWKPFVFPLSYGNNDPIAGCGGPAQGALATAGSDRIDDAWVTWTLAACHAPGAAHGAPTTASFLGEGNALTAFAGGAADLAYTAGGFDKDMGLVPSTTSPRPAIAVPIALDAAVIGLAGGVKIDATHRVPYSNIQLLPSDVAALLSGGRWGAQDGSPASNSITGRCPAPPSGQTSTCGNWALKKTGLFNNTISIKVAAFADAETENWYGTRWVNQFAPKEWVVPQNAIFGADQGKPRGVDANLALAQPSYQGALDLQSGRPALVKGLFVNDPNSQGATWVLSDLETAKALALSPAELQAQNGSGDFVAPTEASLDAAVPGMKADSQGILISDPSYTTPQNGTVPYPLTFVEYALVPAEPLVDSACTPRAASQALLISWLNYVTGAGQAQLPSGMYKLPPSLQAQAAAAIKQVGAAPSSCSTGTGASSASGSGASGSSASSGFAAAAPVGAPAPGASLPVGSPAPPDLTSPSTASSYASAPGTSPDGAAQAAAGAVTNLAAIPAYAGRPKSGWLGTAFGLLGIMALSSLALYATARRR